MNMEFDPTATPQEQPAQEHVVSSEDHTLAIAAIKAYQDWLSNRERSGPFGASWGTGEGEALVKRFCQEKGW